MVNGETQLVGLHIPPYKISTVEPDHLPASSRKFFGVHNVTAQTMGTGVNEKTGEGKIDTRKHHRLGHATLNPQLVHLGFTDIKRVHKWYNAFDNLYESCGHGLLSDRAIPEAQLARRLRLSCHSHSQAEAPDLLCVSAQSTQRARYLIQHRASLPNLRSADRYGERLATQREFNDPNYPSEIMITTILVSSTSLNLYLICADVVFVDVPGSANAML